MTYARRDHRIAYLAVQLSACLWLKQAATVGNWIDGACPSN